MLIGLELDALVRLMAHDGSAEGGHVGRFKELVAAMTALYRPHIAVENEVVFPVAARVLPAAELQALGAEMRARRQFLFQNQTTLR